MQANVAVERSTGLLPPSVPKLVSTPQIAAMIAVDAIGTLNGVEGGAIFREQLTAFGNANVIDQDVQIVPDRLGEFGAGCPSDP